MYSFAYPKIFCSSRNCPIDTLALLDLSVTFPSFLYNFGQGKSVNMYGEFVNAKGVGCTHVPNMELILLRPQVIINIHRFHYWHRILLLNCIYLLPINRQLLSSRIQIFCCTVLGCVVIMKPK